MTVEPSRGDLMLMGRMLAAVDMLHRCGAKEFETAYDDDTGYDRVPVVWWATAKWNGARIDSELFPYPAQAAEDLLARVMNGGHCTHCKRTVIVGVMTKGSQFCNYVLVADDDRSPESWRYQRTCEVEGIPTQQQNRAQRRDRGRRAGA